METATKRWTQETFDGSVRMGGRGVRGREGGEGREGARSEEEGRRGGRERE